MEKITLVNHQKPLVKDVNYKLQWLGNSLGLFSDRDKDKSCFRIFITLLKSREALSSDQLASKLNLSRGTVMHHINKLMEAGLVIKNKKNYTLREKNLTKLLDTVEEDINNILNNLKDVAENIDEKLGV